MRLARYLKAAFLDRWNLLLLGGATAFAFLTGRPDVFMPLVGAVEIAYLGLLGTHPRFQRYVEAREASARRRQEVASSEQTLRRITASLPPDQLARYAILQRRCAQLRQIAFDLRQGSGPEAGMPLERMQLAGLDRLLWIYLRLLHTQHSLDRFLAHTSEEQIHADIRRLEQQLADLPETEQSDWRQKARRTVHDNLETSRARLLNVQKARENHELVALEIDRLDNKIRGLSELAVNRQEPQFISDQVDAVAASMLETERTMNQLQFATGLTESDEQVPALFPAPLQQTTG